MLLHDDVFYTAEQIKNGVLCKDAKGIIDKTYNPFDWLAILYTYWLTFM
jgi:hypothetical protein